MYAQKYSTMSTGFSTGRVCEFPVKIRRILVICVIFKHLPSDYYTGIHSSFTYCIFIHKYTKMRKIRNLPHFVLQGFAQNGFGCVGIEAHVSRIAGQVLIVGLGTDHSAVITAEFQRGHIDRCA